MVLTTEILLLHVNVGEKDNVACNCVYCPILAIIRFLHRLTHSYPHLDRCTLCVRLSEANRTYWLVILSWKNFLKFA